MTPPAPQVTRLQLWGYSLSLLGFLLYNCIQAARATSPMVAPTAYRGGGGGGAGGHLLTAGGASSTAAFGAVISSLEGGGGGVGAKTL